MGRNLVFTVFIAGLCFCSTLQGSDGTSQKKITDLKNPAEGVELGGDLRFRFLYDNARKLDKKAFGHDRIQMRFRARIQTKIKLTNDLDFNIRFVSEPRYFIRAEAEPHHWAYHEGLFDKFNLTWRNAFDLPMTVVVGRQEIRLGSGWLIADGTPLDGGRTGFFDALRFTYDWADKDTTADVILIDNHGDSAKWLKPFNDKDIDLSEQDEQGAILYLAKKTSKDSGIDLYFIYKHDTKRIISSGSEGEIYTIGFRKYGRLNERWQYNMEFAPQFGHKNGKSLGAFATNNYLIYNFNDEKNNRIYLGYEYLSGNDDPDKYFDKAWGRIDTWSVLYQGNIDTIDGKAYESSNLHRIYIDWATKLTENTELKTGYALLFADDNTYKGGSGGMSKSGNFRGQLARIQLSYKASENIEHRLE
ncbi:MAG: alginate export family protein, partial [Phycisphaerae bacterium]|nr:alginate export family protein [Phycisphaerae bacterium]